MKRFCKRCGTDISESDRRRETCSDRCRVQYHRRGNLVAELMNRIDTDMLRVQRLITENPEAWAGQGEREIVWLYKRSITPLMSAIQIGLERAYPNMPGDIWDTIGSAKIAQRDERHD